MWLKNVASTQLSLQFTKKQKRERKDKYSFISNTLAIEAKDVSGWHFWKHYLDFGKNPSSSVYLVHQDSLPKSVCRCPHGHVLPK